MASKNLERGFDINERYTKLSQREHVLRRPDTYVGGTDLVETEAWVWDEEQSRISRRNISFPPALLKIFDEVLVNARDHSVRDENCTRIRVELDRETGTITVENNGEGIAVEMHDEGCMLPELIFGRFRAGENFSDEEQKVVGGRNGLGSKCCLIWDTPIPTWDGNIKHACELTLDDKLIGDDGTVRHITAITTGHGKMYEVSQGRLGEPYQVNDQHILTLHMPDHKVIFWNASKNGWSVLWWDHDTKTIKAKTESLGTPRADVVCEECGKGLAGKLKRHYSCVHKGVDVPETERKSPTQAPETEEALAALEAFCKTIPDDKTIDISIQDYMKLTKTAQSRLAGLRGDCVQWPSREVSFDPYFLGLWLGDGYERGREIACDESIDPETIEYLQQWCESNKGVLTNSAHYISSKTSPLDTSSPLLKKLETYDLINNKHIPEDYLINDRDTRLQVLAGLIDSDVTVTIHGTIHGTRVIISQGMNHQRLCDDITFLARSLGFFCSQSIHKTTWTNKGEKKHGQCYKMQITGDLDDIPTRLPRKRCANGTKQSSKTTGKITVKEIEDAAYVGVSIDGNRRFLINDFTVTHNCNVFSTRFEVDTVDKFTHKRYIQVWENNMSERHDPVISTSRKAPYTKITFTPDYARLGGVSLYDDGIFSLLKRRVYDMAACTREQVLIYLNGAKLSIRNFEKYMNLYLGDSKSAVPRIYATLENEGVHPEIKEWQFGIALSDDGFRQVSFVNGIATSDGGTHVDYLQTQLVRKLGKMIREKNPNTSVKPGYIRENMTLFVNAVVVNPAFSSQVKESLTTRPDSFGFKHSMSAELIGTIEKRLKISKRAIGLAELRKPSALKAVGGRKKQKLTGILKLEDAKYAGTRRSAQCTLIMTEGDSAKTMAMDGLQIIGRDYYGVFPWKGKPLNARNASDDQLAKNEEFISFMKIMGLQPGVEYTDGSQLRYGSVMLMTDQDLDGFHIKGIAINNILHMWPSLLQIPGFIKCFVTPIVKLQPTNPRSRKKEMLFFNMSEFEAYRQSHPDGLRGMKVRYLKGLGSSEPKEARAYFADFSRFVKEYRPASHTLEACKESFEHAFSDTFADWRKKWLEEYDEGLVYDYTRPTFTLEEYADRELKHFSIYDNQRSLGHVCDGLKISQRKSLWGMQRMSLWNETKKVLAVAGEVSSRSSYHHGEKSMMDTMIGQAQTFVGANNVNLLYPSGQFGCLDPDTPILTHTLERVLAKEVHVGDVLVGDDGLPRTVLKTVSGVDEMFDIHQDHGITYRVNSQHILTLSFSLHKVIYWKASTKRWSMEYLDHKEKTIKVATSLSTSSGHFNTSTKSKDEAYDELSSFAKEIDDCNVIDISVKQYMALAHHQRKRLRGLTLSCSIPYAKREVTIDPYILGMWLGDGMSNGKRFSSADPELVKIWIRWGASIGIEVTHLKNIEGYEYGLRNRDPTHNNVNPHLSAIGSPQHTSATGIGCQTSSKEHNACDWTLDICNKEDGPFKSSRNAAPQQLNRFAQLLKGYDLINNKHLPVAYILNDEETRLKLLAGMIDTNGTLSTIYSKTGAAAYEISQAVIRRHLIEGLRDVASSLGFQTAIYQGQKGMPSGTVSNLLTLRITGEHIDRIPVKLSRKKISAPIRSKKNTYETRIKVVPAGVGEFVGWQVDGNERFLLGDFTITHNSRLKNGKDASDARYIHTRLNDITKFLFRSEDDPVLRYEADDEGKQIEPKHFMPIVATVLLNGCNGIGTGYSTDVPMYHPLKVVDSHIALLEGRELPSLQPWYRGYRGTIAPVNGQPGSFYSTGIYERVDDTTVRVTEVPVGQSFDGYKAFLEKHLMENAPTSTTKTGKRKAMDKNKYFIKEYESQSFPSRCDYSITFPDKATLDEMLVAPSSSKGILKKLRLRSTIHTRNMHLFTENGAIRRFTSPEDIIQHHSKVRLDLYAKRKAYQLEAMAEKIAALDRKSRFMRLVLGGTIDTRNRPKREIAEVLREHSLVDENEMDIDGGEDVLTPSMKVLLRISLLDMTEEEVAKFLQKIEEVKRERDELEATSPEALWLGELKTLRGEMERFLEEAALEDELEEIKPVKKKTRAVKRRKPTTSRSRKKK
jgi:DNA gyrase/topoisomerase IV subunit B